MYANENNGHCYNSFNAYLESENIIGDTAKLLAEIKELMNNPLYDLQASVGILLNEHECNIIYEDGTQFCMEKR